MYNFKDQAQAEEFFIKATSSGADPIETIQFMKSKGLGATPPAELEQPKTLGGFAGNVVKSGLETAGSIGSALLNILNPDMEKNTLANVAKLAVGTGQLLIPGEQGLEDAPRAVGAFYKNRYGSLKAIGDTLYNDPVGALVDASMIADLGGMALTKGVSMATKGAKAVDLGSNTAKLGKLGTDLSKAGKSIDPLRLATKGIGRIVNPKLEKASGAVEGVGKGIRQDVSRIYMPASIYGAEKEAAVAATLDKYGALGSSQTKYEKLKPIMESISKNIDEKLSANPVPIDESLVVNAFNEKMASTMRTSDITTKQAQAMMKKYLSDLSDLPVANMTSQDLFALKKIVNSDATKIFDALERNIPLTPKQEVILAFRNTLDDVIRKTNPEVKELTVEQSHLFDAADSLNRSRKTNPTTRIAGTTVPAQFMQEIQDRAGKVVEATGKGIGSAEVPTVGLSNVSKGLITFEKALQDSENNNQDSGEYPGNQDTTYGESNENVNSGDNHTSLSDSSLSQDNTNVNSQKTLNSFGATPEQIWEAYVKVAGTGNKRKAALLKEMFDQEIKYQSSKNPKLNSSAAKAFTDSQTAVSMAQQLEETISQYADKMGPVKGAASGMNPYDTDAQTFRSQMEAAAQVIGKSMEGGVLRQEDVVKYRKILPQITDTVAVARNKIKNIRALLEGQQKNQKKFYQNMQPDILTPDTSMPQGGGNGGLGKYPPKYLLR